MVPDSMEQPEVETMGSFFFINVELLSNTFCFHLVSNTNPINRSFEQQLNGNHNYYNSSNQINKYHW